MCTASSVQDTERAGLLPRQLRGPQWDPWENDGAWVTAMKDPSSETALRLAGLQPKRWQQLQEWYRLSDDAKVTQLWRKDGLRTAQWRAVPEPSQRLPTIQEAHHRTGHWGTRRTTELLATTHWFPALAAQVKTAVNACEACQRTKASFDGHHPELQPLPIMGMFYRWSVDLATMPVTTKLGNKYVMVMIEHYSKYVVLAALPDKEAKHTAAAFRNHVLAMFGGCAEVLSDNGGEFEGEFEQLLRDNYIDPRRITPGHSQSNGLAERCVQTVKRALQRMVAQDQSMQASWDEQLFLIQLGYNCSKQEASRLIPYEVLFARTPQLPSEATQDFLADWAAVGDQEDTIQGAQAADELIRRAALVGQYQVIAMGNLAIAQQRDTLRYATVRGGGYLPRLRKFHHGDYVRLKYHGAGTLQPAAREGVYKFHSYRPGGVVVITGQEADKQFSTQLENIAPSHQLVQQPADEILVKSPSKQLACEVCRFMDNGATMLLCDYCDTGWHTHCLDPPLHSIPDGAWFCPPCAAAGRAHVRIQPQGRHTNPDQQQVPRVVLTPPRIGWQFDGWRIKKPFEGHPGLFDGYLRYQDGTRARGGRRQDGLFQVIYEDGDREVDDLVSLRPYLVPESPDGSHKVTSAARPTKPRGDRHPSASHTDGTAPDPDARTPGTAQLIQTRAGALPAYFPLDSVTTWLTILNQLWPGATWPRGAVTRYVNQVTKGAKAATGPSPIRHITTEPEVHPLALHVDWRQLKTVFDPWAGNGTIGRVLQRAHPHLRVYSNELDPRCKATTSLDALQPGNWALWRAGFGPDRTRYNAIACSPFFPALDLAIPMMMQFTDVLFVHVQATWVFSATDRRIQWCADLLDRGCLRVITNLPRGNSGAIKCCWMCIFSSRELADMLMLRTHDVIW